MQARIQWEARIRKARIRKERRMEKLKNEINFKNKINLL
jgi:hypothetical protein